MVRFTKTSSAIRTNKPTDRILGERIGKDNGHESFTVLFYATRPEPAYEAQFDEAVHQDLRRATYDSDAVVEKDNRPLFEKYQFFTPGTYSHARSPDAQESNGDTRHFHGSYLDDCSCQYSWGWNQGS